MGQDKVEVATPGHEDVPPMSSTTSDEVSDMDDASYPDGGTRAWVTLFACFCSFFAALSMMNSVGVYQTWVTEHQLKSSSTEDIGWIFGFYNFFSFFAGIFIGPVFDAKGPVFLSAAGAALLLATYLILAVCREYWHFFLCFGVMGSMSTCLLFTSAVGTVQHWFMRRRGLATGLAISGGSIGGICCPLILGELLPKIGWAWSMRVIALIMVPFLTVGLLLMKSRQVSNEKQSLWPDLRILLTPRIAILTTGTFFVEIGMFIPLMYVASYALRHDMSTRTSYLMVTLLNVGSLLGRLLPGWLGDKVGRFNTTILAICLCLISILAVWLPAGSNAGALIAFVILFGLGSGSGISLVPVCIAQLCRTEDYGKYFTAVYSVASIGSLIGVPLAGTVLVAGEGNYLGLILFSGSAYVIALIAFVTVRLMSVGVKVTMKF